MSDVRGMLRLQTLAGHLSGSFTLKPQGELEAYRKRGVQFDPALFQATLEGPTLPLRKRIHAFIASKPDLFGWKHYLEASREGYREQYVKQIYAVLQAVPLTKAMDEADPRTIMSYSAALGAHEPGLPVRLSVHLLLYGDTLKLLGTAKHSQLYDRMITFKDYGCFCMTELGHGSNVSKVETTATYDHASRQFVLNSPVGTAAKWWIGALGKTANMAVVFAQLIIGETNHGVHVFVMPIRDYSTHDVLSGLKIGDCGPKEGLNGIDNGWMLFQNYRVPYDALLDRFSQISADGKFKSSIKNPEKRFSAMLAGLCRGRISVLWITEEHLRNALTVAIRYGAVRRQFGPKGETPILDYPVYRYRLMPHLANSVASCAAREVLLAMFHTCNQSLAHNPEAPEVAELHAIISVVKPLCSWYSQRGIQECREATGGSGFSGFTRFGQWLVDNDVNSTWEGDNWVLLQQTSKYILKNMELLVKGKQVQSRWLSFLSLNSEAVNRAKARFSSKAELRDNPELLKTLLVHKVQSLVGKCMMQLQRAATQYSSQAESWTRTQVGFFNKLALAFGEFFMATSLLNHAETARTSCTRTGSILLRISELYICSKISHDLGFFRDHDYLSTDQSLLIQDYERDLCEEVGESSVRIVDAYGFEDHLHSSVAGMRDGQLYRNYTDMVEGWKGTFEKAPWLGLLAELRKAF